ncbi:hypothetical protein PR202_gb02352 [Eleusine coracana subsp. coracana]|uniref:Fe2OG dioxygenase domain-containing protein n=1 Tax=Eleusine coracana subsp. coracana TaxID=191504 RepID=A0AAV5DYC2_ELECO|nr:hypothetical protein QOZ80_8BG0669440 [Eleusine coracana subsp. coracana]GJN15437.1 hypothetical protein PR202_gb02352 [Eleusine coracana subsp. coracana]
MAIVDLVEDNKEPVGGRAVMMGDDHEEDDHEEEEEESRHRRRREQHEAYCVNGVRHLSDSGITRLPDSYVLPPSDRPNFYLCRSMNSSNIISGGGGGAKTNNKLLIRLPVVDLDRGGVVETVDAACREYGFFQVVNHGVATAGVLDVARRFFALPFTDRARYMSADVRAKVRYGTSFNQANDDVLCWRDFLKLGVSHYHGHDASSCSWPQEPADLREVVARYAMANHALFTKLMDLLLQALFGINNNNNNNNHDRLFRQLLGEEEEEEDGSSSSSSSSWSQMMTLNCYPACPEPELTLGMPPHSDYGLLTLVLQDHVEGLQVMHDGRWLTVEPVPGSFVVNVGDHLEIFSNGRYKSVLHRVLVNSSQQRISVASFHTVPPEQTIGPAPELIDDLRNPRRYMDTDFDTFLAYLASAQGKHKTFLQSRKLPAPAAAAVPS